jgi:hypothetical protein
MPVLVDNREGGRLDILEENELVDNCEGGGLDISEPNDLVNGCGVLFNGLL